MYKSELCLGMKLSRITLCFIAIVYISMFTCSVDIEVSGFVGHIAHWFQAWTTCLHLAGVSHSFGHVHKEGAVVNVLPSKQHLHLGTEASRHMVQTCNACLK